MDCGLVGNTCQASHATDHIDEKLLLRVETPPEAAKDVLEAANESRLHAHGLVIETTIISPQHLAPPHRSLVSTSRTPSNVRLQVK